MFIKTCDTLVEILRLQIMANNFRKYSDGRDESFAVMVIDDFFSYENLVHKRLT
jgi:hypothetical protein